jgi:hypothetical protein
VDIFRIQHQSIEVEILKVNGAEMCTWAREHAVEKELDKFEGCSVGSHIIREADAIAANGDAGAIRIILFQLPFIYHHGVADFLLFMDQDVMIIYKEKGYVTATHFALGEEPEPMPWHSHPSSLA